MSENLNVFSARDENIAGIYGKKANSIFILLFSCLRTSGVTTDVAKQNRNSMTSTLKKKTNISAN